MTLNAFNHVAGYRPSRISRVRHDTGRHGILEEQSWRCISTADGRAPIDADIMVSRWTDPGNSCRREDAVSPPDRYVVGIALETTQLRFTRGRRVIFDGIMPAGTLHVTGPARPLTAEFFAPCDFIHFHVSSAYFRKLQDVAHAGLSEPVPDLNDVVVRDSLAELLGRTLIENGDAGDGLYTESLGQALVMHIARMELSQPAVRALAKWRLKRVREYVDAHFNEVVRLADLAAVAGLSRMHFAGQFRAATGYRPHDYLLYQRIERAKSILSGTDMPLAEVALNVGFQAQAHFSTVFKRHTGQTPARWRRASMGECQRSAISQEACTDTR